MHAGMYTNMYMKIIQEWYTHALIGSGEVFIENGLLIFKSGQKSGDYQEGGGLMYLEEVVNGAINTKSTSKISCYDG